MPMFVRKRWGWGISPGDWRGWLFTVVYLAAMILMTDELTGIVRAISLVVLTLAFVVFSIWAFARKI